MSIGPVSTSTTTTPWSNYQDPNAQSSGTSGTHRAGGHHHHHGGGKTEATGSTDSTSSTDPTTSTDPTQDPLLQALDAEENDQANGSAGSGSGATGQNLDTLL